MALFPAYSNEGSTSQPGDASLSWLCNASCPPEVGQPPPTQSITAEEVQAIPLPEDVTDTLAEAVPSASHQKKKKKDKKKHKKKKKKKKRKKESSEGHTSSSEDERRSQESRSDSARSRSASKVKGSRTASRSPVQQRTKRSQARSLSRDRRVRSPSKKRKKKSRSRSKSKERRRSATRERARSDSRSRRSKSKSRRSNSRSKRSHSRSRTSKSRSKRSHSRSRSKMSHSRSRRSKSWSNRSHSRSRRSKSRSKRSSRSRSRKRSRSRSRRRSKSRKRSELRSRRSSRSRSRRRSHSRSKKRSRSRSRRRSHSRSKKRSRSRSRRRSLSKSRRFRSRSRSRRRSKSRSRSRRKRSRSRGSVSRSKVSALRSSQHSQHTRGSVEKILSSNKSVFLEDVQGTVKPEEAFFISTDGDGNNRTLAATHYTQLARYKTKTKGELGSSQHHNNQKKKPLRYFKKSALRALYSDPTPVKRLLSTTDSPHENYMPLSLTYAEEVKVKSAPALAVNSLGIYDSKTEEYISGTGGLTLEDDIETHQDAEYEMWQSKAKRYNERLGKEPHNIALWLEFVRFQDSSYKILYRGDDGDKDSEGKTHKLTQKALAERKVSILDTAIKKNMRNLELCFERLEIGKDLWDDKKLKQEWDTLVFSFPNKISVWHKYLAYVQTHFTSFSLTSAIRTFSKCTEKLQQMRDGVFLTHAPPQDIGRCLVDVSVQVAHVWRQSGFMERSIALFQALVELNLFYPKHSRAKDVTLEAKLALLEPFWDSRAARFGEENAVGWAQVMQRREPVQFPEVILEGTVDEEDDLIARGGTTSTLWLALEMSREVRHWLPWEQDPEDCEDPDRMVPLDELSPHLFTLNSVEEKFYLVLQFLRFLGVPDIEDSSCQGLPSPKNPRSLSTKTGDVFRPLVIETLTDANLFGKHFHQKQNDADKNFLNFEAVGPSVTLPACDAYYQFLCRAVQQAANVFELQHRRYLTLLHIKLLGTHYQAKVPTGNEGKLKSLGKEIKKQIKSLLKSEEFRTCLPVYQEYGKVEEAMGHVTEAENVYITALTVGTASGKALESSNEDFRAVMDLSLSYIHLEMDQEVSNCTGCHSNNILQAVCSLINEGKFAAPDGSLPLGGNLLKAKKKLLQLQDHHSLSVIDMSNNDTQKENERILAMKAVTFLALIQLLTVGFRPACLVFESTVEKVSEAASLKLEDTPLPSDIKTNARNTKNDHSKTIKAKILECLYEDYLWIIEAAGRLGHLVKDGSMSPVCLRSVLTAALKAAPENPRFLLLLAQNQSWRNLIGGLETLSSERCSIITLVSQLLPHIHKTITLITHTSDGLLSCGHRLESMLEQAVSRPPGSHCPLLWRLYLALVAATRPKGLKNLTYRALVHCPGVKSVYLDCVRLLPSMLREVVKLLTEKGMRVRLPLEELEVLTEKELEFEDEDDSESSNSEEEGENVP